MIASDVLVKRSAASVLLLGTLVVSGCAPPKPQAPVVDNSATSRALQALPRYAGPKKKIVIGEFNSVSPKLVSSQAATDMMITALVKSGAFAVLDRESLSTSKPAGKSKHGKRAPALPYDFILKGELSEANAGADVEKTHLTVGGMETSSDRNADGIGIDLRIIDAGTGVVVDSVNVRKQIQGTNSETTGIGKLLGKYVKEVQKADVDLDSSQSTKESVDAALRACIEQAVVELVQRLDTNRPVPVSAR